jgi:hypothetical protein
MRRLSLVLALVFLAQLPAQVWANTLPKKIGYTIFAQGVEVGHSDITVTETATELVLDSKTRMKFGTETMEMSCRTVADPKTFFVRSFDFNGTKAGTKIDGQMFVEGDSLYGTVIRDDQEKTDYRITPYAKTLMFEDYMMEHQVLIALAHSVSEVNPEEYGLMLPASKAPCARSCWSRWKERNPTPATGTQSASSRFTWPSRRPASRCFSTSSSGIRRCRATARATRVKIRRRGTITITSVGIESGPRGLELAPRLVCRRST